MDPQNRHTTLMRSLPVQLDGGFQHVSQTDGLYKLQPNHEGKKKHGFPQIELDNAF